ncbi:MAG: hypothetical protein WAN65_10200, partial [Candidatus Sulfotelmatobacter sp.]
ALQSDKISALNTNQHPGFATVVCPATKSDAVTNDNGAVRWQWNVALSAGGEKEIEFVACDGHAADSQKVQADVTRWSKRFSAEFDDFKKCWEQRWADAFTPGNHHFSGSLPVLVTDNAALKRNYYMGIVTLLELERTQFPVFHRSFITSGERAPGTQFYWDASLGSTVWALLEPAGMKATLRRVAGDRRRAGDRSLRIGRPLLLRYGWQRTVASRTRPGRFLAWQRVIANNLSRPVHLEFWSGHKCGVSGLQQTDW